MEWERLEWSDLAERALHRPAAIAYAGKEDASFYSLEREGEGGRVVKGV